MKTCPPQGWNRLANAKIEDRLSRLWARKQREKEEKFAKLRKQHERELRMLAKRSQKKVETIFRGIAGKDKLDPEEIVKYEYASAPVKARTVNQMVGAVESRYLETYQGVLALERDPGTLARLTLQSTATPRARPRKEGERKKPPATRLSSGSLLKEFRVEKTRPETPSVLEEAELEIDEEQAALLLQKTLRGRAVQLRLMKGRARRQDQIEAMRTEHPVTTEDAAQVRTESQQQGPALTSPLTSGGVQGS